MNPLIFLKAVYQTFGTPYPRASLIVVMIVCAALGAGVWLFLAKQVENDRIHSSAGSSVSGPASTTSPSSPANTGNGNSFQYGHAPPPKEEKPPKLKE
jgi:hypothetical protein